VKIQNMGGKVCLKCKGKSLLGIVNKLLKFFALLPQVNFPPIFCIFTEGEGDGDGIDSRISIQIFSTLNINTEN
jgi:hypothetical protein